MSETANAVFDLDGTLITCESRQSAVLRAALAPEGAVVDPARVWALKREGETTESALRACGVEKEVATRIIHAWLRMIEQPVWLELDTLLPSVTHTLSAMRGTGYQVVLLTARSRPEWLRWQLRRLGLDRLCGHVVSVSPAEVVAGKAGHLRRLAARAFFGDSESDIAAARDANVEMFPVSTGQRSFIYLQGQFAGNIYGNLADAWAGFRLSPAFRGGDIASGTNADGGGPTSCRP